jgi:lysine 2,3-aminomutase
VRDVLLSGGDPLTLPPKVLEDLLRRLREIPHIEIIRIGSRVPVFMPQRITPELVNMLRQFHPLWMNIHINHSKEITPELARACALMSDAGIPLGNQSVLLAGVNDHPDTIRQLLHDCVKIRVRPYYLYQCDLVEGSGHFRTTVAAGLEIMEALRGHTSGYAVPTYCVDLPGGGGKVPVHPNYLISHGEGKLVFRNFEGYISTYTEPEDYKKPKRNAFTADPRQAPGQRGVAGLQSGDAMVIKPEGWNEGHHRDGDADAVAKYEAQKQVEKLTDATGEAIPVSKLKATRDVEVVASKGAGVWTEAN